MSAKLILIIEAYCDTESMPRVTISEMDGKQILNVDAEDATRIALEILTKAEQAKADSALLHYAAHIAPSKPQVAGSLLDSFRELRERLEIESKNRQDEP